MGRENTGFLSEMGPELGIWAAPRAGSWAITPGDGASFREPGQPARFPTPLPPRRADDSILVNARRGHARRPAIAAGGRFPYVLPHSTV